jgi:hypothetical protein
MAINTAWHSKNPMPANPTLDQRVRWHLAHAKHCDCRPVPASIRAALRRKRAALRTRGERRR